MYNDSPVPVEIPHKAFIDEPMLPFSKRVYNLLISEHIDYQMIIYFLNLNKYYEDKCAQYYLCQRLTTIPDEELPVYIQQLSHILLTRRTNSWELEKVLLKKLRSNVHAAPMMIWMIKAHLNNVSAQGNAKWTQYVYNIYKRFNEYLFELPESAIRMKCQVDVQSALISLGIFMICPLYPEMSFLVSRMIIDQSTLPSSGESEARFCNPYVKGVDIDKGVQGLSLSNRLNSTSKSASTSVIQDADITHTQSDTHLETPNSTMRYSQSNINNNTKLDIMVVPTLEELLEGRALSFTGFLDKQDILYNSERIDTGSRNSNIINYHNITKDLKSNEMFPGSFKKVSEVKLSYTHYVYFRYIRTLVNISKRLCSTNSEDRQNTLIGELSLLDYNMPVPLCIPFSCENGGCSVSPGSMAIRIVVSESTVLNSSDRAPFLLTLEIADNTPENIEKIKKLRAEDASEKINIRSGAQGSPIMEGTDVSSCGTNSSNKDNAPPSMNNEDLNNGTLDPIKPKKNNKGDNSQNPFSMLAESYSERMYMAAIMLSQLYQNKSEHRPSRSGNDTQDKKEKQISKSLKANFDTVRDRILKEISSLEKLRIETLEKAYINNEIISEERDRLARGTLMTDNYAPDHELKKKRRSSTVTVLNELWKGKEDKIRASSVYGNLDGWKLVCFIVKAGADLRQEQLAMHLIFEVKKIFRNEGVPVWLKTFGILVTSHDSGLIEVVKNSVSVHSIKSAPSHNSKGRVNYTLYDYFLKKYGPYKSPQYRKAQDNFMRSLAAYSIICYIFQIKDRHNGNILIDEEGHIIHIDFGFILSNSPGSLGFEMASFKLSQDYVDILGGPKSEEFTEFRELMKQSFLALRKNYKTLTRIVHTMEEGSFMACFNNSPKQRGMDDNDVKFSPGEIETSFPVTNSLRSKFVLHLKDSDCSAFIDSLIDSSYNSVYTRMYDWFQYYTNGYA